MYMVYIFLALLQLKSLQLHKHNDITINSLQSAMDSLGSGATKYNKSKICRNSL